MYGKIFRSLWEGSMRGHSDDQLVFIFLIAHADANGVADIIHQAISEATGLGDIAVRAAIARLESPDLASRSPDAGGRRIVRLDEHRDWGWVILNYPRYREASDIEKIREQNKLRAQRRRDRAKGIVTERHVTSRDERERHANVTHKKKEKEKEKGEVEEEGAVVEVGRSSRKGPSEAVERTGTASRSRFVQPTPEEVEIYCRERGNRVDVQTFLDHYTSNGWRVGRNPMKDWKAAVRTWEKHAFDNGTDRNGFAKGKGAQLQELGRRMKEAENEQG